jgi:4-carboxymuconolactone decarboxylase
MPAIPPEQMTDPQRAAADEITAGPRGGVVGPFIAALRSPECMRRLQHFGAYLRYDSAIPPRLREIAVLLAARRWRQDFEWATHEPLARAAGVPAATIDAIRTGTVPATLTADEAVVVEVCGVLFENARLSDSLYERAVALLGERGVIDLICVAGYYSTLAMIMNAVRTSLPEGLQPAGFTAQ